MAKLDSPGFSLLCFLGVEDAMTWRETKHAIDNDNDCPKCAVWRDLGSRTCPNCGGKLN